MFEEKRGDGPKKKLYLPHRIILVRPENPENAGFSARAMKSCGFAQLIFVGQGLMDPEKAAQTAVWSKDILEAAPVYPTLAKALDPYRPRAAFTARITGKRARRVHTLEEWAEEVTAASHACDLVFGPESRGLESAEVDLCDWAVTIPTHPDQPSLNLSHAVQLACYALYRRRTIGGENVMEREKAREWATRAVDAALFQGLFPRKGAEKAVSLLTKLLLRASLNPWETQWLEKQARDFWGTLTRKNPGHPSRGKA